MVIIAETRHAEEIEKILSQTDTKNILGSTDEVNEILGKREREFMQSTDAPSEGEGGLANKRNNPYLSGRGNIIVADAAYNEHVRTDSILVYDASELSERKKSDWEGSKGIVEKLYPRWRGIY